MLHPDRSKEGREESHENHSDQCVARDWLGLVYTRCVLDDDQTTRTIFVGAMGHSNWGLFVGFVDQNDPNEDSLEINDD